MKFMQPWVWDWSTVMVITQTSSCDLRSWAACLPAPDLSGLLLITINEPCKDPFSLQQVDTRVGGMKTRAAVQTSTSWNVCAAVSDPSLIQGLNLQELGVPHRHSRIPIDFPCPIGVSWSSFGVCKISTKTLKEIKKNNFEKHGVMSCS